MAKRTIYVRDEDQALFDRLAEQGNLSAAVARAVRDEAPEIKGQRRPSIGAPLEESSFPFMLAAEHSDAELGAKSLYRLLPVDLLKIEVGRDLLHLVDPQRGAALLERIGAVRRHLALDLGFIMGGVRFCDNLKVKRNTYSIFYRGVSVGSGEIEPDCVLVIGAAAKLSKLKGVRCKDPTYGMPGVWVPAAERLDVEAHGFQVFDPVSVVATHLTETVKVHAGGLLGLDDVKRLLDYVRNDHPVLVDTAIPGCLSLVELWQVLRGLLQERVPIRDLALILESIVLLPNRDVTVENAMAAARVGLRFQISKEYVNDSGEIGGVVLDAQINERLRADSLNAGQMNELGEQLRSAMLNLAEQGWVPMVIAEPDLRVVVRDLVLPAVKGGVVLSLNELPPGVTIKPLRPLESTT